MQTRPGEQDFSLFDIYFGCNTFFVGHKGYFLTNSRLEKEGTIFNCKGFRISSIFRIIWISAIFSLYFYILLQIENIICLFFCCEKLNFLKWGSVFGKKMAKICPIQNKPEKFVKKHTMKMSILFFFHTILFSNVILTTITRYIDFICFCFSRWAAQSHNTFPYLDGFFRPCNVSVVTWPLDFEKKDLPQKCWGHLNS
jgi:hypothetical protein